MFRKIKEILNDIAFVEAQEYGYCCSKEHYKDSYKREVEINIYEMDNKTYLVKYIDKECVLFEKI